MRWRIYYGDGSTYCDRDGDPYYAPSNNIIAVAQESKTPSGFILMHRKDQYFWRPDVGWNGCDVPGLWDYLLNHVGPKQVIFGRVIRDELYYSILERAGKEGLGQ